LVSRDSSKAKVPESKRRAIFAVSCAEQLAPTYFTFVREARRGSPGVLRGALDIVWQYGSGYGVSDNRIHEVGHQLENAAPELERFRPLLTLTAIKAVAATYDALLACGNADPKHAFKAADHCREAVSRYLSQVSDPTEGEIHADPFMRKELDRQQSLLTDLAQSDLSAPMVNQVRSTVGEEWANDLAARILSITESTVIKPSG
jgi:uncharacterized protein YjaG (DUF416 family)